MNIFYLIVKTNIGENMDNKLSYIYRIDILLNALYNKIQYNEYIKFIKGNEALSMYDKILSYVQIKLYPIGCLNMLDIDYLDYLYDLIINKIKRSI